MTAHLTMALKISAKKISPRKNQRGLVLFVALMALVALSLAAAALIRSVDTSVLAAGNLAFKQSAVMSGDATIALAGSDINNLVSKIASVPNQGYYSQTVNDTSSANYLNLKDSGTWVAGSSQLASGAGFDANGTDTSGNTVRYVIQRMCRDATTESETHCLMGTAQSGGDTKKGQNYGGVGVGSVAGSPMYRITARVTGPKNTLSYIQAYAY